MNAIRQRAPYGRASSLSLLSLFFFLAAAAFAVSLAACGSSKQAGQQPTSQQQPAQQASGPKRYQLEGSVVSLDPANKQVVVDGGDIPGFMMAMTMPYPVKDPNQLKPLAPKDQIKADVVVNGNDVYLDNIVVTKKAEEAKPPASGSVPPAPPSPKKGGQAL